MKIADRLFAFRVSLGESPLEAGELFSTLDADFNTYDDLDNHTSVTTFYCATVADREALLAKFRAAQKIWESDLGVKVGGIELVEIPKEEWSESWKKYFHPIEISDRLLVSPSWLSPQLKPKQKKLVIDPGMSFGTGQHATTLYCLKCIDRLSAAANPPDSLLDAGCGSGILTIAGALAGIPVIDAFDLDPDAVKIAAENLALNGFPAIRPTVGDAAVYPGRPEKYALVCANILGHLLIQFRHNIVRWVRPGGHLVLAGILEKEFDAVSQAYTELGLAEVERFTLREWTGGLFRAV